MARRILRPFAENGDRTAIDDDTQSSGIVNYQQGYPARYSLNPATDPTALRLSRARHNQLWHDLSSNTKEWQEQFAPSFITAAANGGVAFSYPLGMVVYDPDNLGYRRSTVANNTAVVTDNASWEDHDFSSSEFISQIVRAVKLNGFSTVSTSPVAVPGLSVTLTLADSASDIRIQGSVNIASSAGNLPIFLHLYRDAAPAIQGDVDGNRTRCIASSTITPSVSSSETGMENVSFDVSDTPGGVGPYTYQIYVQMAGGTGSVNRSAINVDSAPYPAGVSSIVVTEERP